MDNNLNNELDKFLEDKKKSNQNQSQKQNPNVRKITTQSDLVERIDRKLIMEDGRSLLCE